MVNIFFLIILCNISFSMIVFPFKPAYENKNGNINKESDEYNSTHFLNDYFNRELYITIKIGNPSQKVKVLLSSKVCGFKIGKTTHCIKSKEYLSYYNRNKSDDFNYTKTYSGTFTEFGTERGYTAEDSIYAYTDLNLKNEQKYKKIGFYLGSDTNDELCGIIGFKMDNYAYYCNKINDLIRDFKSINVTNNYKWILKYTSIDEGYYIIGAEMRDLVNKYNDKNFFNISSLIKIGECPWSFSVRNIKCEKDENIEVISKNKICEIENDFSLIMGTDSYYKYINKTYFYNYLKKGFCLKNIWIRSQINNYYIIECDKSNFGINDIINFPNLIFVVDENGKELVLDYNDLFTETKHKYFFNIIFNTKKNDTWTLGKILLKKYMVMFDLDTRMIEIYNNYGEDKSNNNELSSKTSFEKIALYICIIIVLLIITAVLAYLFGKNLNKLRKKRANELLEDDYEYKAKEENEINSS